MSEEILNKELISAMMEFANNSSIDTERNVYLAFSNSVFLMPAIVQGDFVEYTNRIIDLKDNTEVQIAQFTNEDKSLYPAFTSLSEVYKWNDDLAKDNIYLIKMTFHDYEELLEDQQDIYGFVINPYHQDLIIGPTQIKRYHEIIFEDENKDAYSAPITALLDDLRENYSLELEDRIYHMFQNLRLLMLVQVPNESCASSISEEGVAEIAENTPINVMPLENEQGEQVFPVFTDLYEAKYSGVEADPKSNRYLMEINFDGLESLISMNDKVMGFAINPFNHNIIISDEQLAKYHQIKGDFSHIKTQDASIEDDNLAQQLNTTPEEEAEVLSELESTPYQLETDVEYPQLTKAISKELSSSESVNKAYLALKHYYDSDSYLIVIDKERDGKNIVASLREIANKILTDQEQIEFLSHNELEAKPILEKVQPFYEKSKRRKFLGLF